MKLAQKAKYLIIKLFSVATLFAFPLSAFAVLCPSVNPPCDFASFVTLVLSYLKPLVGIIISLALLTFFWGIVKYINAGGDEKKLEEGKKVLIYGILALFVIVSVWGLVALVRGSFGI